MAVLLLTCGFVVVRRRPSTAILARAARPGQRLDGTDVDPIGP
ncbi:hypothetical protein ACH47C_18775 [Streptomyces rishiriensis]